MKRMLAVALTLAVLAACSTEPADETAHAELTTTTLDAARAVTLFEAASDVETLGEWMPATEDEASTFAERSARLRFDVESLEEPVFVDVLSFCFATCLGQQGCAPQGCQPTRIGSCSPVSCSGMGASCGRGACYGRTVVTATLRSLEILRPQLPDGVLEPVEIPRDPTPGPDPVPPGS